MKKIATLLRQGWVIDQIQFDRHQGWYYTGARHESQEANATGNGTTLTESIDDLYKNAIALTPKWYLEQLSAQGGAS